MAPTVNASSAHAAPAWKRTTSVMSNVVRRLAFSSPPCGPVAVTTVPATRTTLAASTMSHERITTPDGTTRTPRDPSWLARS